MDINLRIHSLYSQLARDNTSFWDLITNIINEEFDEQLSSEAVRLRYKRYRKSSRNLLNEEIAEARRRPARSFEDYEEGRKITFNSALFIGDTHHPFCHEDYLPFILRQRDKYKPEKVFCIGDWADQHAQSRYPTDPDGMSARHEYDATMEEIEAWKKEFDELYLLIGNHDDRPFRLAFERGTPKVYLRTLEQLWETPPGWEWAMSYIANEGMLPTMPIQIEHGVRAGKHAAENRAQDLGISVIMGHTHVRPGVKWLKNYWGDFFGLNVGCGVDVQAYAMAYGKKYSLEPSLGCAVVLDYGALPIYIAMNS